MLDQEPKIDSLPDGLSDEQVALVVGLIRASSHAFRRWMESSLACAAAQQEAEIASFELRRQMEILKRPRIKQPQ